MTASAEGMATILAEHRYLYGKRFGENRVEQCSCGWQTTPGTEQHSWEALAAHQAEVLAANGYGKLPEPTWNPDLALVGPKKCNGCGNEIKGGSRHGFCADCLGDEW